MESSSCADLTEMSINSRGRKDKEFKDNLEHLNLGTFHLFVPSAALCKVFIVFSPTLVFITVFSWGYV